MNLAVKFYRDAMNKPEGMPEAWPAEVIELGDDNVLPDGPYVLMTKEEYNSYRELHWSDYSAWESSQVPQGET